MTKLIIEAIAAFREKRKFKKRFVSVVLEPNVTILAIYDTPIAYLYNDPENTLSITNAYTFTKTTKDVLNGLPNVDIVSKQDNWFLNGKAWDGKLIDIPAK